VQIARNEVLQAKRQVRRRPQTESLDKANDGQVERLVDSAPDPAAHHAAEDAWQAAVAKLPPVYRAIAVRLRCGALCANVAAELGVSERMVYRVLERVNESMPIARAANIQS
jgi:DNA-directed RNA polymerase specialized sigma24 family protein